MQHCPPQNLPPPPSTIVFMASFPNHTRASNPSHPRPKRPHPRPGTGSASPLRKIPHFWCMIALLGGCNVILQQTHGCGGSPRDRNGSSGQKHPGDVFVLRRSVSGQTTATSTLSCPIKPFETPSPTPALVRRIAKALFSWQATSQRAQAYQ